MWKLFNIDSGDKRVYGLDILRAAAILVVVVSHTSRLLPEKVAKSQELFLIDGVFLFFVLSGFLIGTILIKILSTKKATFKALKDFWVRRWFRTIPTYFLILTVLLVLSILLQGGVGDIKPIQYYLFLQNFSYPNPDFFPESWTLSVEEWFYILIPSSVFILAGLFKLPAKRAILAVIISVIVVSIAIRLYKYSIHPPSSIGEWDMLYRKEVITRLDSLVFGVLGAYIAWFYKDIWVKYKKSLFIIGLSIIVLTHILSMIIVRQSLIVEPLFGFYLSVISFTIIAFGIFLLLPLLSNYKTGKGKVYKAITTVSISSYSMYLIHLSLVQPLVLWLFGDGLSPIEKIIRYALYWGLTIALSILLYKYFEKPTTNAREHFTKLKKARMN